MSISDTELANIRELDGKHCPTCFKPVAIDRYGISPTMVTVLQVLAGITSRQLRLGGNRAIDVRTTSLTHNERSTLSKLRQHGLIAKVRGEDNKTHIAGHWLVTTKGFNFLGGAPVPARVEVYNNTVLGHPGGEITIKQIEKEDLPANHADLVDREYIDPSEARLLSETRDPKRAQTFDAVYQRNTYGSLEKGTTYTITVDGLTFGKPVKVIVNLPADPLVLRYGDISAFRRDWKLAK